MKGGREPKQKSNGDYTFRTWGDAQADHSPSRNIRDATIARQRITDAKSSHERLPPIESAFS
jgi:hypothetical protein